MACHAVKFFIQLGQMENLRSAVLIIVRYLKLYADTEMPAFIEVEVFKVRITLPDYEVNYSMATVKRFLMDLTSNIFHFFAAPIRRKKFLCVHRSCTR